MRFQLQESDEGSEAQFKSALLAAMQEMTTDRQLVQRIAELRDTNQLDSPHLSKTDLDTIRSKIQVFTKVESGEANVKVSFFGYGSEGEQLFVKSLCEDVLRYLRPSHNLSEVSSAISEVSNHLKEHVGNHDRFSNSLKTMVQDVEERIAHVDSRMRNVWESSSQPVSETLVDTDLRHYQEELERLKAKKDRHLVNRDADSRLLQQLDEQIGYLDQKVRQLDAQRSEYGFTQNTAFRNASFVKNRTGGTLESELLSELSRDLGSIQIVNLVSTIDQIDSNRRGSLKAPIEYLDRVSESLPNSTSEVPLISLIGPGEIASKPMVSKPSNGQILMLAFLSIGFGSIVAWRLNPRDLDRGFADVASVEKSLGVPVVSQFQLQSRRNKENHIPISIRLTKICEVVAVVILALLVISCLLGPEIRTAMLENPLEGLARIVWHFRKS